MSSNDSYKHTVRKIILLATSPRFVLLYSFLIASVDSSYLWRVDPPETLMPAIEMLRRLWADIKHEQILSILIAIQFSFSWLFWYALILLSTRIRWCSVLILFPLLFDFLLERYCNQTFGLWYDAVIESAFNATVSQATTYITPALTATVLILLSACGVFFLSAILRKAPKKDIANAFLLCAFSVMLPLLVCKGHTIGLPNAAYKLSLYKKYNGKWATWIGRGKIGEPGLADNPDFQNFVNRDATEERFLPFYRESRWIRALADNYFPPKLQNPADSPSECALSEEQEINVVLYIVESFRADHAPFMGYARNTLPLLSAHCKDNMIVLPGMDSFDTFTMPSLYGILSDADSEHRKATHASFQTIFRKHGYHTVLIENCTDGAPVTTGASFKELLKESTDSHIVVEKNADFVSMTKDSISTHTRNMYVIFDGTSHYPFDTASGKVFGRELMDLYDETKLDVDKAAYDFLESVKRKPSIVLVVGDHGESFNEEGRICHGGPLTAKEQRHVMAFVWYSDSFAEQFPDIIRNLQDNAKRFNSHDQIFHTLPSMGSISTSAVNKTMDMASKQQQSTADDAELQGNKQNE